MHCFFYTYLNNRRTGKDATKPRILGLLGHSEVTLYLFSLQDEGKRLSQRIPFSTKEHFGLCQALLEIPIVLPCPYGLNKIDTSLMLIKRECPIYTQQIKKRTLYKKRTYFHIHYIFLIFGVLHVLLCFRHPQAIMSDTYSTEMIYFYDCGQT